MPLWQCVLGRILRLAMGFDRPPERPFLDFAVEDYYAQGGEEQRLKTVSKVEFLRTQVLLQRFLQRPPAVVLDVGGGAGGYAIPLQSMGYDVKLVDPVQLHVEQARRAGVCDATVGDARNLAAETGSAGAILLLGPLYHLVERDDRLQALREARRVLMEGGVLIAAAISRFASTYDGLYREFLADPEFEKIVQRDLTTGVHLNPGRQRGWFTTSYFHHPTELAAEVVDAGFELEATVAVEGPAAWLPNDEVWLDNPARRQILLDALERVEQEPSILGASAHIIAIGRA